MMLNRHFLLALIAVLFTSNVQAAEPTSPINGFYLSPELSAGQQNYSDASITSNSVHRTFSVRIPANVTGHSGDRDRFAHGHHAGVSFVL